MPRVARRAAASFLRLNVCDRIERSLAPPTAARPRRYRNHPRIENGAYALLVTLKPERYLIERYTTNDLAKG